MYINEQELLKIITDEFLCIRRLPFEIVSYRTYYEGDENKKYVDSNGKPIDDIREVVEQEFNLEYFENNKPQEWDKNLSSQERLERFLKNCPSGKRKLLKITKKVKNGGWWYVKKVENTDSTIRFDRKYDKFFAKTLEEAIKLYLDSKK